MAEFTGERVIPGEVDADLWNEHLARYAFAARLSRRKRVLDAGCGTGYGSAELARGGRHGRGRGHLRRSRRRSPASTTRCPTSGFLQASCAALPLRGGSFDLVVAFEVIEHLRGLARVPARDSPRAGARRASSSSPRPTGTTTRIRAARTGPIRTTCTSSRFEEFREELRAVFPHVSLFLENHVEGFVFQPAKVVSARPRCAWTRRREPRGESHFFVAVCALAPQTGAPTFLYVPRPPTCCASASATSRARSGAQGQTIAELTANRDGCSRCSAAEEDLRRATAGRDSARCSGSRRRIRKLQKSWRSRRSGYEAKIAELEEDNREKTEWALDDRAPAEPNWKLPGAGRVRRGAARGREDGRGAHRLGPPASTTRSASWKRS